MGVLATLPSDQIGMLLAGLVVGGLVTGFLAGLLGIGGGGILVPVLYETFGLLGVPEDVRMHVVLGTSFAIIAPTAYRSYRAHAAKGAVDVTVIRRLGPYVVAGVIAGIAVMSMVSSDALKWVWIVMGLALACKMAMGREDWRLSNEIPSSKVIEATTFVIGLISTLMSIGGGMFVVTMLTLLGRPIHAAVATSSGFGPLIAIPGVLGYMWAGLGHEGLPPLSLGYVNILAAALIVPLSVLAAPLGARAAHGLSRRALELAFAAFLATVSVRLLLSLIS